MNLQTAVVLLLVACTAATRTSNTHKNRRIIRVRVPQRQFPDYVGGQKGSPRPNGFPDRYRDYHNKYNDFIRPNQPSSSFNYGSVYLKSRPPPQKFLFPGPTIVQQSKKGFEKEVVQKIPPIYGNGFPHKSSVSGFKFPNVKDEIRTTYSQNVVSLPPSKSSSSSSVHPSKHQPSSSSASHSSVHQFSGSSSASFLSGHQSSSSSGSYIPLHVPSSPSSGSFLTSHQSHSPLQQSSASFSSGHQSASYSPSQKQLSSSISSHHEPTSYQVSSLRTTSDDRSPIKEIPAPNLALKPEELVYETYGKGPSIDVTHLIKDGADQLTFPASEYFSTFSQPQGFNVLNDNHLTAASVQGATVYKNNHITDGGSVKGELYNPAVVTVTPAPTGSKGYEVTEGNSQSSGNSAESQYYYAPDPDPSAPVHKVPSAKDPFGEEKEIAQTYLPSLSQNFQILEGGTVAAPVTTLSAQELFQLMNGYTEQVIPQTLVAEPVVTLVGHPQQAGVLLQQNPVYAQSGGGQYLQVPVGLHGDASQQVSVQHVPLQSNYQQYVSVAVPTAEVAQGYQQREHYEPEASESERVDSLADEEQPENSVDSGDISTDEKDQVIIRFNKTPEVPFFTTLPSKEAAETLASLQAAGSIGSSYTKQESGEVRGDQGAETEDEGLQTSFDLPADAFLSPQRVKLEKSETSVIDIQKSIPLYEDSYSSISLDDESSSSKAEEGGGQDSGYGERIRPK